MNAIIRVNDIVRLIDPRRIQRIGYEVTTSSLLPEIECDPEVLDFCKKQKLVGHSIDRVMRTIAVSRTLRNRKTGAERRVYHDDPIESFKGGTFQVTDKKVRYTGRYYSASSGSSWDGEYDYEPAGLDKREAHVCLELAVNWLSTQSSRADEWSGFWVLGSQVEKVNIAAEI